MMKKMKIKKIWMKIKIKKILKVNKKLKMKLKKVKKIKFKMKKKKKEGGVSMKDFQRWNENKK